MPSVFPSRAWERVASDLFDLNGSTYILVVDYFSRWVEVRRLDSTTSEDIIHKLKSIFATHGIPEIMVSDNGPQYSSAVFKKFSEEYGFLHVTSSPKYPQANGAAERAVQTIKNLLKKNKDPYLALLAYRSAPLQNGLAPCELLMGRKINTRLPVIPSKLSPKQHDFNALRVKEEKYRDQQEKTFNRRHRAINLPLLKEGDCVWVKDQHRSGTIIEKTQNPRSYIVGTEKGEIRRNRSALVQNKSHSEKDVVIPIVKEKPVIIQSSPMAKSPKVSTPRPNLGKSGENKVVVAKSASSPVVTKSGRTVHPRKILDL